MNKILATLLVGGAVVGGVAVVKGASAASTPEVKTCTKIGELCGAKPSAKDFDQCVEDMEQMHKMSGDPGFTRSAQCIEESKSCAAVAGCLGGGIGVSAVGEMMKGFGTALSK
jgi:hypothetical protein